MYQAGAAFIGEGLLTYSFNGERTRRIGNRHSSMAPHGCYPCLGEDQWVTIAVRDDQDWQAFCAAVERPDLAVLDRFATASQRLQNQDELDDIVAAWTGERSSYKVMEALQCASVPAGPVLTAAQALRDPHFRHRGFFERINHPEATALGTRDYIGRGWKFSQSAAKIAGPAPLLGEANSYALCEILGLPQSRFDALAREEIIGTEPIGGRSPTQVPLETQAELGWIAGYVSDY